MKVVLLYAYGTLIVSVISLITDGAGMSHPTDPGAPSGKVLTLLEGVQIFWFFMSIAAVCYFLSVKASIRVPLLYTLYSLTIVVVTLACLVAIGGDKSARLPLWLYILDIIVTIWIAAWAAQLARYAHNRQKQERAESSKAS